MSARVKIAAAASVGLVALTGCSASEGEPQDIGSAPTMTSTPVGVAPERPELDIQVSPETEKQGRMMRAVESDDIFIEPSFATDLAGVVCRALGRDTDPYMIALTISEKFPQFDAFEASTIVGASVGAYCPEHAYIINNLGG